MQKTAGDAVESLSGENTHWRHADGEYHPKVHRSNHFPNKKTSNYNYLFFIRNLFEIYEETLSAMPNYPVLLHRSDLSLARFNLRCL